MYTHVSPQNPREARPVDTVHRQVHYQRHHFYCSERLKALACEFHSSEEAGTAANADRAGGRDTSESRADGAECAGAGPPWCIADTTSAVVDSVRDTNWMVYAASCADSLIGNRLCSGIQVCGLELSSPGPLDRGCSLNGTVPIFHLSLQDRLPQACKQTIRLTAACAASGHGTTQ